jgi:hypothetical protein
MTAARNLPVAGLALVEAAPEYNGFRSGTEDHLPATIQASHQ